MPVGYFPHAWYLAVLKEKVFDRWTPPSEYFQSSRPPTAVVSFRIDRGGGIGGITLKESSGSARFDKSALAAVQGLGRVPVLPEQYREETLDVVIRFQNQR
jgi:TonB family protein